MNKVTIIIIVCIIIAIVFLNYSYNKWRYKHLTNIFVDPKNAKTSYTVPSGDIKPKPEGYPESWSLSFWIYIDDWNYKYAKDKYIVSWENCNIWLSKKLNDLNIYVPTFNNRRGERILVKGLPLQKWLHVCVVLENRDLDIWLNGKLYNSKHLSNIPFVNPSAIMTICDKGGFSGYISRLRHYCIPIPKRTLIHPDSVLTIYQMSPFPYTNPITSIFKKIKGSVKINVDVDVDTN